VGCASRTRSAAAGETGEDGGRCHGHTVTRAIDKCQREFLLLSIT
jgi:hypothetical protein